MARAKKCCPVIASVTAVTVVLVGTRFERGSRFCRDEDMMTQNVSAQLRSSGISAVQRQVKKAFGLKAALRET
jgi:hypothetical protein